MIKYYFYNNHIVPLYIFKGSALSGERLSSYLEAATVKISISKELGALLFSKNIINLSEVDPADLLLIADKK